MFRLSLLLYDADLPGKGGLFLSGLDKVDSSMAYSPPHAMMQTVCRSEALVFWSVLYRCPGETVNNLNDDCK